MQEAAGMSIAHYELNRAFFLRLAAGAGEHLPSSWPARRFTADPAQTLAEARAATAFFNEGLLAIGFGDGSLLTLLLEDALATAKLIHVIVLPTEMRDFAHWMGTIPSFEKLLSGHKISIHFPSTINQADLIINGAYGDHESITRLAGTAMIEGHPLHEAAEAQRTEWLPALHKTLVQRFDCLGNDVYDTFLGAKHALMHGLGLVRQNRSGDYRDRYAGKSAICIAAGPSCSAFFDRIREVQHEHVIICADSNLGGLLDLGIEPDFTCMVERPESVHRLVKNAGPRCSTVLFALPVVHPSSAQPFGDRVAWWWNADDLYPWLDPAETMGSSGRSSGTMTVALAAALGCSTIHLVGHDLAFKDGVSHGAGTDPMAFETQKRANKELTRTNPNYYWRAVDAPRNGGGLIDTMGVWEIFRSDIESIIASYDSRTTFINHNIRLGTGAVIHGSVDGDFPTPTGIKLEKSHPTRQWTEEQCAAYRARALQLSDDFAALKSAFRELEKEIGAWRPMQMDRAAVEGIGARFNLTKPVDPRNRAWFAYVFRAALRNLMVRLHLNTYVRTMAERNWNQVQVMRTFAASIPNLLDRLEPELKLALEAHS
jgi:hypothetical protein